MNPQPVDNITPQPRGQSPIVLELDIKLTSSFLLFVPKVLLLISMLYVQQLRLATQ